MSDGLFITVTARSRIAPELLFRAWIDPLILPRWLAPAPYDLVAAEVDARPGGAYLHHVEGPDGQHVVRGQFLAFEPGRHLRKSWVYRGPNPNPRPEPTQVDVTFDLTGEGMTRISLTHSGLRDDKEQVHYQTGWTECFERLERLHGTWPETPAAQR